MNILSTGGNSFSQDSSAFNQTILVVATSVVRRNMIFGVACLPFEFDGRFVPLFVSYVGDHLESAIRESHVVFTGCSISMPALFMTEIVVMLFYCILPIVVGLNLKEVESRYIVSHYLRISRYVIGRVDQTTQAIVLRNRTLANFVTVGSLPPSL